MIEYLTAAAAAIGIFDVSFLLLNKGVGMYADKMYKGLNTGKLSKEKYLAKIKKIAKLPLLPSAGRVKEISISA